MLQWSPPDDLKRDLTVGTQHVRISCASYTISPRGWRGAQRQPWDVQVKAIREAGFTAAESGGWGWNSENVTDSDIRQIKSLCEEFDVEFNTLHVWANIIHPEPEQRARIHKLHADAIEYADRLGMEYILTHTVAGTQMTRTSRIR